MNSDATKLKELEETLESVKEEMESIRKRMEKKRGGRVVELKLAESLTMDQHRELLDLGLELSGRGSNFSIYSTKTSEGYLFIDKSRDRIDTLAGYLQNVRTILVRKKKAEGE